MNIHNYMCHVRDTNVATVFIFSQDLKNRKTTIFLVVPCDNISASAHEVKVTAVKRVVVRVAHCPTDSKWLLHTGGVGTLHLALLILTTDDVEASVRRWHNIYRKNNPKGMCYLCSINDSFKKCTVAIWLTSSESSFLK